MAANLTDVGIQASAVSLLESLDYSKKVDEAVILDSDSSFGDAEAFNPVVEFSMRGRGSLPAGVAIGGDGGASSALTGINDGLGTRIITSLKQSETNTDFDSWELSGTYFPNATTE